MRKSDRWIEAASADLVAAESGTTVLVAVDGFSEPGRECRSGELLMPEPPCWRANCTCEDGFHGVGSHGRAAVGRVARLRGVPRGLAEAEIAAAMAEHEEFTDPAESAASFLDEVATIEEGRLVRREVHLLMPFPMAARITAPHSIRYGLDDEP